VNTPLARLCTIKCDFALFFLDHNPSVLIFEVNLCVLEAPWAFCFMVVFPSPNGGHSIFYNTIFCCDVYGFSLNILATSLGTSFSFDLIPTPKTLMV